MQLTSKPFLIVVMLLLPALMALVGIWQMQRGAEYHDYLLGQRGDLKAQFRQMSSVPASEFGGVNTAIQFQTDGTTYVGDLALEKIRDAIDQTDLPLAFARYRQVLSPVVIGTSLACLLIGAVVLLAAVTLAGIGAQSRPALLANFSIVRKLLPATLIALVVLTCLGVVSALLFEAAGLVRFNSVGSGPIYLIGLVLGLVAIALVTAYQALSQLGRFSRLFEPVPYDLIAETVSLDEAPGLWHQVREFAQRLGAPVPDIIAIGLTQGFFVSSGQVRLLPSGRMVAGNTLHVPLGMLAFMEADEVAAIVGHELAHFAGDDTLYSQQFLPIYNGFSRSLDAVAAAGRARDGSLSFLAAPALALGYFVQERFHLAVQHWSRIREFEADRKSVDLTSAEAAGRAMLRHGAVLDLLDYVTNYAWTNPDRTPANLVPLMLQLANEQGLADPSQQLGSAIAHPTDSHPHNSERLAAFGITPTPARIAVAMAAPADAGARLAYYFADPTALSIAVTRALIDASHNATAQRQESLSAMASAVGDDAVELYENSTPIAIMMFVFAVPLLAVGAWTFAFSLPGIGDATDYLAALFVLCGGFIGLLGLQTWRRSRTPFMRLFPDRMEHRHLDRPIYWSQLRDLSAVNQAGTMVTTLLLKRSASYPKRVGGRGRIILNPGAWLVTIRSVPPKHYKARGYIELIGKYADAAAARAALAQNAPSNTPTVPGDQ